MILLLVKRVEEENKGRSRSEEQVDGYEGPRTPHSELLVVWRCSAEKDEERSASVQVPAGGRQKFMPLSSTQRQGMVRQLQQELADALKKQSTSEAALEVTPRYRRDLEEDKLRLQKESEEVKTKTQAASQDRLEEIRASHHTSLRHQLQHRIRDLECELDRVKNTREDSVFQKESTQAEAERFKELYLEEMKIGRCLANKLERATERVAEAKAKLLQERHRSKSLLRSSIVSEGVAASPVLYSAALGHLGSSLALNRSLSLGGSFLNSARTALSSRSRVEAYVAQYINTSKGMLQTQDDVNGVT
ncbi:uncharacterized protein O9250_002744 [Rhynochetos jubatus]